MPCCDTATRTRCCSCSARWKSDLKLEEMDQYAAANAQLIAQLELLAEMEDPSLENVL